MYYKANVSALIADVTIKVTKDGRIRATAIGRDPETETVYTELGKVTSKVYPWSRRETAINEAIHKLETVYYQHYGNATATAEDMVSAFKQVQDTVVNDGQRLSPRWKSASTNNIAIQYYERNVLPLLLPFADSSKRLYLASDRDAIEQTLIEATERRNGQDHERALESVHTHLREADIIYQHMLDRNSSLPEIRLSSDAPFTRAPKPEQIKYLPRHILLQFYKHLANIADEDPRFVLFAVSVVYGMRPAEAAARKPSDIYWAGTYCVAEVSSQERAGKLDPRLKNDYSRRPVIISYWGMRLLQRCCKT